MSLKQTGRNAVVGRLNELVGNGLVVLEQHGVAIVDDVPESNLLPKVKLITQHL